jgi:PilZ domain-containing protein
MPDACFTVVMRLPFTGHTSAGNEINMGFRRRVRRQPADWIGICHIDGEFADEPRACRVLDVSELGMGIALDHPSGSTLIGHHIAVETHAEGATVIVRLEGAVRNAVPIDDHSVRIGIEFVGLTELEESVVKALGVLSTTP